MVTNSPTLAIKNSTVTGNYASAAYVTYKTYETYQTDYTTVPVSPGLSIITSNNAVTLDLESSIISGNYYSGGTAQDMGVIVDGSSGLAISGTNNMVGVKPIGPSLPADTIVGACPRLGPLRDNGGPTFTHALLSGSRAIDAGNNPVGFSYDQRGEPKMTTPEVYSRDSGAASDIGAYEVQQKDIIFNTDFEGCPYLQ
jgi:hypothetical protein